MEQTKDKSQREMIIEYFQNMKDEDMYRIFQCEDDQHSLYDCPYWKRDKQYCSRPYTCDKIPFEQPWTKKKEEITYHVEPEAEQGALFS
jgi:hypothetical protein